MEIRLKLESRIDAIQGKLREINYECNRLKEALEEALPLVEKQEIQPVVPAVIENIDQTEKINVVEVNPEMETVKEPVIPVQEFPIKSQPESRTKRMKREGSMEAFIGGNLLNKIGIAILIIGIGIFVKYAIDKDWIGPVGRVLIGLLSGGILMALAHRMREKFRSFSSVLIGGGVTILYFSMAIAFHQYQLIGQTAAFALMSVITAATVVFSIGYNRQEIAVMALLGGFATPFLLNTGDGNFIALFTYMLVLNTGMLVLSWFKRWNLVRIVSYVSTILLFAGWVSTEYLTHAIVPSGAALTFATLFFLQFFAMNIAYNVKSKEKLGYSEYILLISNSAFYFGVSMFTLMQVQDGKFMGLFTALLGALHFVMIFPVRKIFQADKNLVVMLIGIVLTLLTIAVPVQLEGNYITMFWAMEAVLLLFLANKTGINLMRTASLIVSLLGVTGLVRDWALGYIWENFDSTPFLNGNFITGLIVSGALLALHFMHNRKGSSELSRVYQYLILPVGYLTFAVEIAAQFFTEYNPGYAGLLLGILTGVYMAATLAWSRADGKKDFRIVTLAMSAAAFLVFAGLHMSLFKMMRNDYLAGLGGEGFTLYFVMAFTFFVSLAIAIFILKENNSFSDNGGKVLIWVLSLAGIFLASATLDNVLVLSGISIENAHKVGYPILWGVIGFSMIYTGIKSKIVQLRLTGLALFLLILVKLFAYDIMDVSTGGKIAAFIFLGVLLLVISFLYQKLKGLLFEDLQEEEKTA